MPATVSIGTGRWCLPRARTAARLALIRPICADVKPGERWRRAERLKCVMLMLASARPNGQSRLQRIGVLVIGAAVSAAVGAGIDHTVSTHDSGSQRRGSLAYPV